MGDEFFNAFLLAFMHLFEPVFLGGAHVNQLAAAVDEGLEDFFGFTGRGVELFFPAGFLGGYLRVKGEHFGVGRVGFGRRLGFGKLVGLARVGDDDLDAGLNKCFGQWDFQSAGAFQNDKFNLLFIQVFYGVIEAFWVVGFGFGFLVKRWWR